MYLYSIAQVIFVAEGNSFNDPSADPLTHALV